jgi:hypothetical protein
MKPRDEWGIVFTAFALVCWVGNATGFFDWLFR